MPATPPPGSGPRLREAMPRPLLVVFVVLAVLVLAGTAVLILKPPGAADVAVTDRRPSPAPPFSHDAVGVQPVVPPRVQLPFDPPCPEVAGVQVVAGTAGLARFRAMLARACTLGGAGVPDDVRDAVRALAGGVTLRFAAFTRSGAESTLDHTTNVLYLNVRYASTEISVVHVVPILLHDAAHLAFPGFTPAGEMRARRVELATCRHLIPIDEWPRWCRDARALVEG